MFRKFVSSPRNAGFSLVEVAIVLVIGGLLLSLFTGSLMSLIMNSKIKTTQTRLKEINQALQIYAANNHRLPCVASRTEPVNTADYAKEDCSATAPDVAGSGNFRIGMVPTRTLNLPDEHGYDAWGSRYIYAVTMPLTDPDTYDLDNGRLGVIGIDGSSLITPANSATYVVLSVGRDQEGGYNAQGIEMSPCTAASGLDSENCDGDRVFRDTYLASDRSGAQQFDDSVAYAANFQGASEIPTGAIMAFDLAACPYGWSAVPDTAGRFIIGVGNNYNETAPDDEPYDEPFSALDYDVGNEGGHATRFDAEFTPSSAERYDNRPPYIAYRYCRKN